MHRSVGRGKTGEHGIATLKHAPGISQLAPYTQGQGTIPGKAHPIKLSANESAQGPGAAAIKAYRRAATQLNRYPDGTQTELREAIGEVYGLDPERLICGNGSDELLLLLVRAYLQPGDEVILSENGFEMARIHCVAQGGQPVFARERDYRIDVRAMIAKATPKSKLCIIANPNNPTGTYITREELRHLRNGLPADCLLVIDSAYAEYVDKEDYDSGISLVDISLVDTQRSPVDSPVDTQDDNLVDTQGKGSPGAPVDTQKLPSGKLPSGHPEPNLVDTHEEPSGHPGGLPRTSGHPQINNLVHTQGSLVDTHDAELVDTHKLVDAQEGQPRDSLVDTQDNVVMTRTFSKIHGLAALRIGWAYCPADVVQAVQRIRTPFNTNGPALAAATAAVRDRAHVEKAQRHNAKWLRRMARELPALGLAMVPSVANFYLIRFPEDGGKNSPGAAAFLMERGIIPRPTSAQDRYLRITVGLDSENEAVLAALAEYMGVKAPSPG